jgi:parallel beta-helix repeat protein
MKKIIAMGITSMFLFTVFSTIPSVSLSNIEPVESESLIEMKKWTFMMYDDRDYYDAPYITRDLDFARMSNAHSGKNLNVIILQDTFYDSGKKFSVNRFGGKKLLENLDEINMGDYQTLKDFIIYCKENFPAERYFLDIFDHGGGWAGACMDETDKDWLTMKEIKRALSEAGGVDIISFIVPCLMAVVEGVYELRDYTDVYIGKQPNAGFSLHVVGPLCDLLNDEYHLSNIEIGKRAIDFYKEKVDVFPWSLTTGKALSAMRTDKVSGLVKSIDNLSVILTNNIDDYIDDIRKITAKTESFPTRRDGSSYKYQARFMPESLHVDIYDFAKNCLEIDGLNEELQDCVNEVMDGVNKTVIAEHHTNDHPEAHGLSIYLSEVLLKNMPIDDYMNSGLDFTNDTHWDEFLDKYHSFYPTVDDDGSADYVSIQDAINNCSDGDVVYIKNGVYYENIVVNKSIILVGESCDDTIIDGNQSGDAITITANKSMLYYLGIRNSNTTKASGICILANYTILRGCAIYDSHLGVYIADSSDNQIFSNKISNNYLGIYLKSSNKNNFNHNYLENNKIDVSFSDSFDNYWKNKYLDHPDRDINLILGFKTITIGKYISFKLPWINLNWFPKFKIK